jgi:hypothetical protein
MGIEDEKSYQPSGGKLVFRQTEGGEYNSTPTVDDVIDEMMGNIKSNKSDEGNSWHEEALNRGHGEYVDNVERAAEYCKAQGAITKEEVENI